MDSFARRYQGIAFGTIVVLSLVLGIAVMLPFVPAMLWAVVLSVLTYPIYAGLRRRLSIYRLLQDGRDATLASFITTILTLAILLIPLGLIVLGLYFQVEEARENLRRGGAAISMEGLLAQVDDAVKPLAAQIGIKDFSLARSMKENRGNLMGGVGTVGHLAGQALFTVLTLIFALLTQFFMLRDGERAREPVLRLIPLPPERGQAILDKVHDTIQAVFAGTVLVALLQGAIIGVAYYFAGVSNALLLALVSGILCIIPLLGAPILYIPIGLMLLAEGDVRGAVIVLGVGFVIVSQIDNLIKPFLIGGRVNLHPMAIFFSILGGVLLVGPIGVMAGPMLLTVILALVDVLRERLSLEPGAHALEVAGDGEFAPVTEHVPPPR